MQSHENLNLYMHVQSGLSDVLCHLLDSFLAALGLRHAGQIEKMSEAEFPNPKGFRVQAFKV